MSVRRCTRPLRRALATLSVLLAALGASLPVHAHEVRPALLELVEQAAGEFSVLWKVPTVERGVLDVRPVLPADCVVLDPNAQTVLAGALLTRSRIRCPHGLGAALRIDGLERTLTSAFVRVVFADGRRVEAVATGARAEVVLRADAAPAVSSYLMLGVEHILLGIDHLGFVAGLVLVVHGLRRLVLTLTAFTLAHSTTLAAAALGYLGLPARPVEVLIAFSIAVVAREAWCQVRDHAGGRPPSFTARAPWIVAFGFGLLHGFGFAGALAGIGLPADARVWALVLFNLGVVAGLLLVIALLVPLLGWLRRRLPQWRVRIEATASGALGSVAMYWLLQRLLD